MSELVAAIDDSAAARPVLLAAREIARMFGDSLEALYVQQDEAGRTAKDLATALDVPLTVRRGDPLTEILAAASADDVRGIVVGARRFPSGARPASRVALEVIRSCQKPVIVVPPTATVRTGGTHRLLVPLDGQGETASAMRALLARLVPDAKLEIIAAHVFEPDNVPPFSDQAGHETDAWSQEFLQRWLAADTTDVALELRVGNAAEALRDIAQEVDADVIAMGWKQQLSPSRSQVVSTLVAESNVPLVLVPLVTPSTA